MICSQARSLLDDYLDQELAPDLKSALEEHLNGCSACRVEYDELVRLGQAMTGMARPEPAEGYWAEVTDLILARTVEAPRPRPIATEARPQPGVRSSFYRSALALAASIMIFASTLWLGSSGPVGLPTYSAEPLSGTEIIPAVSQTSSRISSGEQGLITGSMMLVGATGMFVSPAEMPTLLGLDRIR